MSLIFGISRSILNDRLSVRLIGHHCGGYLLTPHVGQMIVLREVGMTEDKQSPRLS